MMARICDAWCHSLGRASWQSYQWEAKVGSFEPPSRAFQTRSPSHIRGRMSKRWRPHRGLENWHALIWMASSLGCPPSQWETWSILWICFLWSLWWDLRRRRLACWECHLLGRLHKHCKPHSQSTRLELQPLPSIQEHEEPSVGIPRLNLVLLLLDLGFHHLLP